ncbi:GNAT family N-acetyltransferase [Streptomyces sp. NBC_01443]|uniref:GNAT family N-acetyltransferase n=1 Tax=Streptomyces sp. NBC_01443 TaxID=2903868 RepID=UPI00224D5BDD|nr:GNAT family N-acetyltransferase [Streptomyces sp. NBC_01443]MCX4633466.1 hypothetical protein [Streptomyces sp. NBC_01443]WSW49781.1 hypothetical protein OG296_42920 [Streptomyces sp. NBC_01001]
MSDRRPGSHATHPWRARRAVGLRAGGQVTNKAGVVDLDLAYLGTGPGPWGGPQAAAFRATVELPREDFAIFGDLAVLPAWRGQGIERRLHDAVLTFRDETGSVLFADSTDATMRGIYRNWRYVWRTAGGSADRCAPPRC